MCMAYVMPGLAEVWAVLGICFTICVHPGYCNRWADWWDYNGISGPQFWGLMNPGWILCSKGRNQSPIDIDPSSLLFDPSLTPLYIQGDELSGTLQNNGHDVTFYVNHSSHSTRQMTVTSGPLSYTFRVDRVRFHFGRNENESGSEHTVGGQGFLVEMQILAFNSELYPDFKTAEHAPHGLLAIAVFARLSMPAIASLTCCSVPSGRLSLKVTGPPSPS
ncbi:putative carbonic anhydrase-like protein 1 [Pomacea canaliculata]|uniref:putative carbonic anhydrase-like protein 1 n=1 Tax=Pomacea canaliculata TaxID=400727 RepID=UPI000D730751|nr:putative carbonic anhydrase-like protein 1 [Pomacea canaliculata]XP_025088000.1 putative carbonic anhydrase-like protein 1 [Pomacea canaliculata]